MIVFVEDVRDPEESRSLTEKDGEQVPDCSCCDDLDSHICLTMSLYASLCLTMSQYALLCLSVLHYASLLSHCTSLLSHCTSQCLTVAAGQDTHELPAGLSPTHSSNSNNVEDAVNVAL